jgi:hypothetical protein
MVDEQKANMLRCQNGRESQARAGDCGGNPGGAAPEDDGRSLRQQVKSARTESLVAAAVQWAERIMRKIDGVHPK